MNARSSSVARHLPVLEGPVELRLATWRSFVRTFALVHRRLVSALADLDVTVPQFDVLATLRATEGVTQQELAERLLVSKGNVTGLLDRMERLGWVERRQCPQDARANRLHLTPTGRKKAEQVVPAHDDVVLRAMHLLSAQDAKALRHLLSELEKANGVA